MSLLVVIGFRNYNLLRDEAYIMLQAVGLSKLQKSSPDITQKRPIPQEQNARRNLSTGFPVALLDRSDF